MQERELRDVENTPWPPNGHAIMFPVGIIYFFSSKPGPSFSSNNFVNSSEAGDSTSKV